MIERVEQAGTGAVQGAEQPKEASSSKVLSDRVQELSMVLNSQYEREQEPPPHTHLLRSYCLLYILALKK